MAAPPLKPTGRAAVHTELLARLGLPASAASEDVDELHQAVSEFLATAPEGIRGWMRAQVAALDTTYLQLTDPVGLEGSALKSPASPPSVEPGGPATPPARRESAAPAVAASSVARADGIPAMPGVAHDANGDDGTPDVEELAALYAMVTPSAHDDMKPRTKGSPAAVARQTTVRQANVRKGGRSASEGRPAAAPASAKPEANVWKRLFLAMVGLVAVAAVALGANAVVNGGPVTGQGSNVVPSAAPVDIAKISDLMAKLQANPNDVDTLLALGTEYYNGGQYQEAANWFDKALAVDGKSVDALLARGAVYFNVSDLANAEVTWKRVVAIEPDNAEAHYDLGFLYLNQPLPNWTGVRSEWNKVIEIDPTSGLAKNVQSHLDSLAAASMLPASSGAPASGAPSAAPSAAPSGPAASASPAGSPAASDGAAPGTGTIVPLSASQVAFGTTSLSAPAGSPFTLRFDNQDAIPHDVVLNDAAGVTVFKGDLVAGPATADYRVPALKAGTYTFSCSIHPAMTGTLTVGG